MEPSTKKIKRSPGFKVEWEEQYAVCELDQDKVICCLCGEHFYCKKTSNFSRHLSLKHPSFNEKFPRNTEGRIREIQHQKFQRFNSENKPLVRVDQLTASKISFELAYTLSKNQKPYEDVEEHHSTIKSAIKHMFKDTEIESLCKDFTENLPVSRRTITRRVECISNDLSAQLQEDLGKCTYFSIQFDESTDVVDTAQLLVFVRMIFDNLSVKEELLTIVSLHGRTTGDDIYQSLMEAFLNLSIPFEKLVSVTSDGAPNITGKNKGLIALLKQTPEMKNINSFHCIIHQQALCLKSLSIQDVESFVIKVINSIKARSTQHRLFKVFAQNENPDCRSLKYYTEVRWLSRGMMLERFYENITVIVNFLKEFDEPYAQLSDFEFISKLAFLVDLMTTVNEFNLQLQGKNKPIWDLIEIINRLKTFLASALDYFSDVKIHYKFPRLQKIINESSETLNRKQSNNYCDYLNVLIMAFNNRFTDFKNVEFIHNYLTAPFDSSIKMSILQDHLKAFWADVEVPKIMADIESLLCDKRLKGILASGGDIWKIIAHEKSYCHLLKLYQRVYCCFGSTYVCESTFSNLKNVKNNLRNKLTDEHLNDLIRISTSEYEPDIEKLALTMQSHMKH